MPWGAAALLLLLAKCSAGRSASVDLPKISEKVFEYSSPTPQIRFLGWPLPSLPPPSSPFPALRRKVRVENEPRDHQDLLFEVQEVEGVFRPKGFDDPRRPQTLLRQMSGGPKSFSRNFPKSARVILATPSNPHFGKWPPHPGRQDILFEAQDIPEHRTKDLN